MPVSELFNLPTLYASSRLVKPCVLIIIIIIIIYNKKDKMVVSFKGLSQYLLTKRG